jgi:hypothetical protein
MKKLALIAFVIASSLSAQVQIGKSVKVGGAGTGTGSVTNVTVTSSGGFQGTVASSTTTPAISISTDSTHFLPTNTGSAANCFSAAGTVVACGGAAGITALTGDVTGTGPGSTAATVAGLKNVPFCTGFTPTNGQSVTYTTSSSPNPCWTASTASGSVSGQASGVVPLATASTTIGAQSHIADDGTKVTVSEPLKITGTGPPITMDASSTATPAATKAVIGTDASGNGMLSNNGDTAARITRTNTGAAGNCVEFASNGVDLANAGVTCTGGFTAKIKYVSQIAGCVQDADPNDPSVGTDDTACINAVLATTSPTNPVQIVQDGFSKISGNGLLGPASGNWSITGLGGGVLQTTITSCTISGGVATFATLPNVLVAGQKGTLSNLTTGACAAITNTLVTVLSSGLTSTQFEVNASGTQSTVAENALLNEVYGTGFIVATGSRDAISNGPWGVSPTVCEIAAASPPSKGANILLSNFILNGNAPNQTNYCFGADFNNINDLTIDHVVFFNASKYSVKLSNASHVIIDGNRFYSTSPVAGTNTDGIHTDGPISDMMISNNYFQVSDDALALNATEGICGPITRVEVTNNTLDNSFNAIRAYNGDLNTCANGLIPLVSKVDINNFSGSVLHMLTFGAGETGLGTLNPAITDFHWSNSTIEQTGNVDDPVLQQDNVGDITFENFTLRSNQRPTFWRIGNRADATPAHLGQFKLDNFTVVNTAAGSGTNNLFSFQDNLIDSIQVDNLSYVNDGGSGTMVPFVPYGSTTATVGQLAIGNIDYTNISSLFGATPATYIPSVYTSVSPIQALATFDGTFTNLPTHLQLGNSHVALAGAFDAASGFRVGGAAPSGHCLIGNGTNYVDSTSCGGGGWTLASGTTSTTDKVAVGTGALTGVSTEFIAAAGTDPPFVLAAGSCASSIWRDLTPSAAVSYGCAVPGGALSDDWHFGTYSPGSGGWNDRMDIITATGDVLIGTTTDDTVNKLQVNGGAKATNLTDSALTSGDLVQAGTGGLLANGPAVNTVCLKDGTNCPMQAYYWNIQSSLFATSTMLGPTHYAAYSGGAESNPFTVRLSGAISCTVAPLVQILDLGTSPTTAYGSATVKGTITTGTSDGVYASSTSSPVVTAGHYYGIAFGSGTCATPPTFDISASW